MFSHFIIFLISIFILATVLFELINLVFLFSLAIAENSVFHFSWFSCFLILSSFMFERFGSKTAPIKWPQREWALPKRQLNLNDNSLAMSIFKRKLEICCYRSIRGEKYQQPLFSEWPKQLWMTAIDVLVNVVFKNGRFWRNCVTMEPESTTSPETSASSFLTICFHWHKSPSRSRWPRAKVWFKQLCAKCRFCCLKTAGKLSARMMLATFLMLPTCSLGGSLVDGILLYCTTQWKKFRNFATRAVPCVLHGDGAAVTQNIGSSSKSCLFLSYKMLCTDQADHMLICGLWNQLCSDSKNFRTISTIWTLVAKSFEQLLNGAIHHSEKFPLLVFTTGDLEYFNVYHNLPRWNSLNPCHYCEITLKDLKRCRVVAPLPPDGWSTPGKTLWKNFCPLWKTLSPYSVAVDWMHSKHLGLDQRMLGSVLWLLTFHIFKSRGSIEERLALLLHKFKEYWRQNAVHGALNSLTLGVLAIVGLLFFSVVFPMCF